MLKTIYPNKLKSGDQVLAISPSNSAATMDKKIHQLAVKRANEKLGLKVSFSKHAFEKNILNSSSIKSRIADLHNAFKDKKIKGIACVRGGYSANTLLPYINWNLIKKNPKPLWGYSDITVLSNAIYAKTGIVAYNGPGFSTLGIKDGKGQVDFIINSFKDCLMSLKPYGVTPSNYFGERKVSPKKNNGFVVIQAGKAEGVIIGGNLCSINLLQGTEYMPSLKDKVLFIEDDDFGGDQSPLEFERNLESLLQLPYVNTVRGLILGRFPTKTKMTIDKLKFILNSKKLPPNIPIISGVDFGHTTPMITFPIGGTVKVEARGKKIRIEVLKH